MNVTGATGSEAGGQQSARLRALVVEDEEPFARLVRAYLEREGFEVDAAADGETGVKLARERSPDVVVLDLMLPGIDGVETCRRLRTFSDAYVVMLTARADEADKIVGLSTGADDYVTKPFSMKELLARVNAHLRRVESHRQADGEGAIDVGGLVIDPDQVQAFVDGRAVGLTPREFEVLLALARAEGRPMARERVYRDVWGYEMMRGDRSVDVFVRKVRQKLAAARPDMTYVQTHYGVGYRFEAVPAGEGAPAD